MALFGRGRGTGGRRATREDLAALRAWTSERTGVEAYVEPQTSMSQTTVVLIAGDGEWTRRRVASPQAAADFARKAGIPVYDTNRVGYPQRMRDYNLRQKRAAESPASSGIAAPARPAGRTWSAAERAAIATLQVSAGVQPSGPEPGDEELRSLWRTARSRSHPDRRGGDRSEWDEVEDAARVLRLERD